MNSIFCHIDNSKADASDGGLNLKIQGGFGTAWGISGSGNYAGANGNYNSVVDQSGIKAGDGGFNIKVANNTDLKGGVISSSDKAIENNKNSLTTGTLTTSDIENQSSYDAIAIAASAGGEQGKGGKANGAGYSSDKGDASSTTKSAISVANITITNEDKQKELTGKTAEETIAGINTDTKNTNIALNKLPNINTLMSEQQKNASVMMAFSQAVPKAIGDYSKNKADELRAEGKEEEAKKWDEGGIYRVALHTAAGGIGGGLAGASANAAVASSAPLLNELQAKTVESLVSQGMDISTANTVASVLTTSVAMGEGALAGGATGGSSGAINGALIGGATDLNNRKLHQNEKDMLEILKKGKTTAEQDKLDAAAKASTQLGRAAAVSTVVGTIGAAEGDPVWTVARYSGAGVFTAAGYVAGGVEQLIRPNLRQVGSDSFVDLTVKWVSDRYPLWSIPINEAGNAIKDSDIAKNFKEGK